MEYPSSYQIFGNQCYEKAKQRKRPSKLQHHQTESAKKYGSIQVRNQSQPIRNDLKIFRSSVNTSIPHTHSHTLAQTTSYQPISLLGAIMKLFEQVIEKRLRKRLEDNGFFSKYQSGFGKSKSTNDHVFRLSQTITESFNWGKHIIAAFLDVEKAFDNLWHNGLKYKIYQLDLPTKLCRWLSDFLVGRVIQVKIEGFLSPKVYPKAGVLQGSNLTPLLFLIYVNDMPNPTHHQTNKLQFADDAGQWAVSKNTDLAVEYLQRDVDKLARWCAKLRIKLIPEKTKVIKVSKSQSAIRAEPVLYLCTATSFRIILT